MVKFLPLFPLNLVAFPGEKLNLHIFEPRYKELVNECLEDNCNFGIPAYIFNKLEGFGTEMKIIKVAKKYEDGRLDIMTEGINVFELVDYENPLKDKLYAAGNVRILDNILDETLDSKSVLIKNIQRLYDLLGIKTATIYSTKYLSFEVGHKVGLSIYEEYELLQITKESERQDFITKHLEKSIPLIMNMEKTKQRIQMNGHFKHMNPLNY
ncbi:MAG TPA: LON peptidase substrate-binding domain-containing protein [Cytophagales bacterium]|nr:LON peptidase substrate-binding domain-containing protein [Cytophagales bacterium]